jgi:hypothetical protein
VDDDTDERTAQARHDAWSRWGTVEEDEISYLVNPMFLGAPPWPGIRQAYTVARRPDEVLIASSGLSDPWADMFDGVGPVNGMEQEFYATTTDPAVTAIRPVTEFAGCWLFDVVYQMSQFAAKRGSLVPLLDELTLLSTELYDVKIPEPYQETFFDAEQRVGVLLGLVDTAPPARVDGPLSAIRLVNIKVLTVAELNYARGGEQARADLARRFAAQDNLLTSDLDRASVV